MAVQIPEVDLINSHRHTIPEEEEQDPSARTMEKGSLGNSTVWPEVARREKEKVRSFPLAAKEFDSTGSDHHDRTEPSEPFPSQDLPLL